MRKELITYIKELLEVTDCVVIPQFGGFVCEVKEARINSHTHTFSPPSKEIMFNESLKKDDGLLTHHISVQEYTGYGEARRWIQAEVQVWKEKLLRGDSLHFEDLGSIHISGEGNIIFSPSTHKNYYTDSFGLHEFVSPAVRQASKEKTLVALPTGESSLAYVATFVLLLALFTTWFYFQWNAVEKEFSQQATLLPVETSPLVTTGKPARSEKPENPVKKEEVVKENKGKPVPEKKLTEKEDKEVSPETKTPGKMHYIVAGAFRDSRNAQKLIRRLKRKGFHSGIAGLSSKGLLIVYYDGYSDANKALTELKRIKRKFNRSAWLYSIEK